jgi:2-iminobutanoate/2-iminopropanoate deaminase
MKKIVSTTEAPAAVGPYSQAVRIGPMLFTAGQIPLDPQSGQIVSQDVAEQTRRVLDNLTAVLKAEGMDFSNIVKTTVFMTNLGDFQTMNEVYASYFTDQPPARSTVQVSALPKGAQVEIEVIAAATKQGEGGQKSIDAWE